MSRRAKGPLLFAIHVFWVLNTERCPLTADEGWALSAAVVSTDAPSGGEKKPEACTRRVVPSSTRPGPTWTDPKESEVSRWSNGEFRARLEERGKRGNRGTGDQQEERCSVHVKMRSYRPEQCPGGFQYR